MTNFKLIFLIIIIGLMSGFAGLYFSKNITPSLSDSQTEVFFNSISKDINNKSVSLSQYKNKWLLVNVWATWCAPCKEEMPSLDALQTNAKLDNLKIFPINIGQEDISKSELFFKELNIQNLEIYFDAPITLAKKFSLRGVPTTILFNKEGKEFARIIGSIDFDDEKFINWLKFYN